MRLAAFILSAACLAPALPAAGFHFGLPSAVKDSVGGLRATLTASAPTPAPASTSTFTASPVDTSTVTPTFSRTSTPSPSFSATPSHTPELSPTPTLTGTETASPSPSASPSATRSASPSATLSSSPSRTATPSATRTASPSATRTASRTATRTASPTTTPTPALTSVAVIGNGVPGAASDGPAASSQVPNYVEALLELPNKLIAVGFSNQVFFYNPTTATVSSAYNGTSVAAGGFYRVAGNASNSTGAMNYADSRASALDGVKGLAYSATGNYLFISTQPGLRVHRVSLSDGTVTRVAGSGSAGNSGDNGPALSATFSALRQIAVDASIDVMVLADSGNNRVRTMLAGPNNPTLYHAIGSSAGTFGNAANGAPISSGIGAIHGLQAQQGQTMMSDRSNHRIRFSDGVSIFNLAGNGAGYADGNSLTARFDTPLGIHWMESAPYNIYVADNQNQRIRKVSVDFGSTPYNPTISTVAGTGNAVVTSSYGASALATDLYYPTAVIRHSDGYLYVATQDYLVLKIHE